MPEAAPAGRTRARRPLRRLVAEVARFGLVGGSGVGVNIAAFNLFHEVVGVPTLRSGVLATCTAIATNYLGFRYYAYRERRSVRLTREGALFALFSVIGLVVENGVLYVGTALLGWDTAIDGNVLKVAGMVAGVAVRFCTYRTWVFPRSREAAEGEMSAE
jgi:putative flippase GtrA